MKLLFESWRKYINEEILNEAPPLGDFGYFKGPSSRERSARPGSGYLQSQDEEGKYKEAVVKFFEDTKDKWYIVFVKEEESIPRFGPVPTTDKSYPELEKLKDEGNWDPEGKYIIANFINFSGDEEGPEWQVVHDLLGHTIDRRGSMWKLQRIYFDWLSEKYSLHPRIMSKKFAAIYMILHDCLPDQFKITDRDQPGDDFKNDVYGAIFLENGPMEEKIKELPDEIKANETTVAKEEVEFVLEEMTVLIEDYKEMIPRGKFFSFDPF